MTVDASSQQLWRRLTDWPRNDPDVLAALQETFATGDWGRYHGEQCKAFVQELASYHAVEHVQLCASGTVAVELALHGLGITPDKRVITHCQTHHRSGLTWLIGQSLGYDIKAYHGSWSEWGNDPDTPIES